MHHAFFSALAAASILAASSAPGLASTGDPLASYLWKSRVLVVLAPDAKDARLIRQRQIYEAMRSGARERDLMLVQGIGSELVRQVLERVYPSS